MDKSGRDESIKGNLTIYSAVGLLISKFVNMTYVYQPLLSCFSQWKTSYPIHITMKTNRNNIIYKNHE